MHDNLIILMVNNYYSCKQETSAHKQNDIDLRIMNSTKVQTHCS